MGSYPLPQSAQAEAAKKVRDPRLDFFRGLAMFIIFIAHTPRDYWALWIPARFGFSDATEIFVFCSGMASAIAFGAVFANRGWLMGTARIAYRVWQVYWAHIGLFFGVLVLCILLDKSGWFVSETFSGSYVASLNLKHFFTKTPDLVFGLFTLTYVPNYFDILPMYLVILAMIPIVMGLSKISLWAVAAFMVGMWLLANLALFGQTPFNFIAEPWSSPKRPDFNRPWFFNPFGWQLVFFTGFAFMRGWIPAPPVKKSLVIAAIAILLITIPFAYFRILNWKPENETLMELVLWLKTQRFHLAPFLGKTQFGILRYIHFLALAYVAWVAVGPMGSRIRNWGSYQIVVDTIRKVGQQSLAVFVASLVIAQFVGALFKTFGTGLPMTVAGNLLGFAALIAVAHIVAWFKGQPWRKPATERPQSSAQVAGGGTTIGGRGATPNGATAAKAD